MTQALPKPITFEEFIEWKPETGRYELHDGTIIEMQPTGEHEEVKGFLATKLTVEFDRLNPNWRDDYLFKVADYEEIGVPEYWIVDYLGLGGRRFIGNPKQPTISIYSFVEDEYQVTQVRGSDCIESPAFPELKLTAEQVFRVEALPE